MTLFTTIGSGVPSMVVSFGSLAGPAGLLVAGLLCVAAAILIAADSGCAA